MSLSARQESLKEKLIHDGALVTGFPPGHPERRPFDDFVQSIHTRDLLVVLNRAIVSEPLPEPLQRTFKYILAILALRPNGVRDVFEFIVAVHPSTQGSENRDQNGNDGRRGPGITLDAITAATRLITSPPSFMKPGNWFNGIAPQIFDLLDATDEKEMASVAASIIGKILGPERYGKPGKEGWVAFAQPILENIAPSKAALSNSSSQTIIPFADLSKALKRLESLTNSYPNPGLTTRLLRSISLPLWAIASTPASSVALQSMCLKPAQRLLKTYFKLEIRLQSLAALQKIVNNLMFKGQDWKYEIDAQGGLNAVQSRNLPSLDYSQATSIDVKAIDHAVGSFVAMISDTADIRGIPELFLELLRKWMKTWEPTPSIQLNVSPDDWEGKYTEAKIVQEMLDKLPEKLAGNSAQNLVFIHEFLEMFVKAQKEGKVDDQAVDQATLVLSLLHIVLSAPGFTSPSFQTANSDVLSKITSLLEEIVNTKNTSESESAIVEVARNLLQFLIWRDQPDISDTAAETSRDSHAEDLKQRDLALSYLRSLDAPPPVRAEGLQLLTALINSKSIVVDVNTTIHLLCSLLQTEEEYIYLHTIKTIVSLSNNHPKTVITTLLEKYIDTDELLPLDPRLRLGEALNKIIETQSINQNFQGPHIQNLGTSLLHVSSLRPIKPKAASARAKEQRLQAAKDKQAAAAWGGSVPDLDDIIVSKQEQEDNEILSKILEGWHGKRNSEDIRIRTSALSIFSTALTANITAFSPSLIAEAVDLSIMILKLETENSEAILRRAAILLILSLVKSLDEATESGKKMGFSFAGNSVEEIREVLGYIEATDADGLVKRHAADVRESLSNWRDKGLLGALTGGMSVDEGLQGGLRGLSVNPGSEAVGTRGGRPIIEEIE